MIYKKYAIEISYLEETLIRVNASTDNYNNEYNIRISYDSKFIRNSRYMDIFGNISDNEYPFDYYEEAKEILDIHWNNIYSTSYNSPIVKIVEIYNDIPIPIIKQRKYKLNKIVNKL